MILHPALVLLAGAILVPLAGPRARPWVVLGLPLVALWAVWGVPEGPVLGLRFLELDLVVLRGDPLVRLFGTIFAIMSFAGGLYALSRARTVELSAAFLYAGSALGVVHAGDLLTLFVFWELMALGSTLVIWSAGTPAAWRASLRYLLIHLLGGVVLMAGVAGWATAHGDVQLGAMTSALGADGLVSVAAWLILAGFLLNAAAPPFWAWLPDAYPEASPSGTVFLSAFTTKTAVFVLLVGFPGAGILVTVGLLMVLYGVVYALLENDLRRLLAYSVVSHVGFMVTAVGIGTELALLGAAAHAFAHIAYKALLFMTAGAVLDATGRRRLTDLGGLARTMPLTTACALVGALSMVAFPLTSGFVSKPMIIDAAAEAGLGLPWLVLTGASAAGVLYAGLAYPWFVFFGRDSGLRPADPPLAMSVAMVFLATLCLLLGLAPVLLYDLLPAPTGYVPYTAGHVLGKLQLLLFAGLAFFVFLPRLARRPGVSVDLDWLYRRAPVIAWGWAAPGVAVVSDALVRARDRAWWAVLDHLHRGYGQAGRIAGLWSTGRMTVWVVGGLGWLVIYYYV